MRVDDRIREYYRALRTGAPLEPFISETAFVKFGVSETLSGANEIVDGLERQTETTFDWVVESTELRTDVRDGYAVFSDQVTLAWTDDDRERHRFDTRWSGTLERRDATWTFVTMHVSVPQQF